MWPLLFYIPWLTTVVHPVLGLEATTCVMMYHYTYKNDIIQRIELSILPNPAVNIFENYKPKRNDAPQKTNDGKAASGGKAESSESPPEMEIDEPSGPSKGDARAGETPKEEVKKTSPYVWGYSTW